MMHLTFSDKSLILGDEAATLVVEYAAALARSHSADTVALSAYGADGDKVRATLLLDEGAPVMVETAHSDLPEPDNGPAVEYMRERINRLETPHQVAPLERAEYDAAIVIADFEQDFDGGHEEPNML